MRPLSRFLMKGHGSPRMMFVAFATGTACALGTPKALAADAENVRTKSVPISAGDLADNLTVPGVLTKPPGSGPFPAVVLLHTCGGPNPTTTRFWPAFFADLGYVTLSIDSFGARKLTAPRDCMKLIPDAKPVTRDAHGALDYLASLPYVDGQRIGALGFSLGGGIIARFVREDVKSPSGLSFRAVASVYAACSKNPPGGPPDEPFKVRQPWLVIMGDRDGAAFLATCRAVKDVPGVEFHELPDVYHAFDRPDITTVQMDGSGNPMLYSEQGTGRAQGILKAFFNRHLAK